MKQFIIILLAIICIAGIVGAFWAVLGPTPFKAIDKDINLVTKSINIISGKNSQQIKKTSGNNTNIISPIKQ
ncbi:MAG: hypothetical protein WAV23_00395 [Minisyncoccia bacterium]